MTKAKIDFKEGLVELEGSEEFVQKYLDEFKPFLEENKLQQTKPQKNKKSIVKKEKSSKSTKPRASKATSKNDGNASLEIIKDLDLFGNNDGESLKDMIQRLKPNINYEYNLVFLHFLKEIAGIKKVSDNHIYTCYHLTPNLKIPSNVQQSLRDTANNRAWLDCSSLDDIKMTTHGTNHLEHEMPKKSK